MIDDAGGTHGDAGPFRFIATDCPACGARLRPQGTASGNVYLRCEVCGTAAI